MQLLHREVKLSKRRGTLEIVCMWCTHHGAYGCDDEQADFWYQRINDRPDTYAIFGGDMVDAIHERDKRYTHQECADWCFDPDLGSTIIDRQYEYAMRKWKPLAAKGKILWLHAGNHEEALWNRFGVTNLTANWCRALKIPYAGRSALSSLTIKSSSGGTVRHGGFNVSFYSEHGSRAANSTAAALNILTKLMAVYAADIYLTGHNHRIVTMAERRIGLVRQTNQVVRMREFDRVGAVCGTFLNSHMSGREGYGERAGYAPLIPGPAIINIKVESGKRGSETVRIEASTGGVAQHE